MSYSLSLRAMLSNPVITIEVMGLPRPKGLAMTVIFGTTLWKHFFQGIGLLIIILLSSQTFAADFPQQLVTQKDLYQKCLKELPAKARRFITIPSSTEKGRWSATTLKKVEGCLIKKRGVQDSEDTLALAKDLQSLFKKGELSPQDEAEMVIESGEIAVILVETTTRLNDRYKMARSALWHNFLIKMGAKEGGYCYEWTRGLFAALRERKYLYFERHWGVHNDRQVTENNAVIFTKRDFPVKSGIIYDAWRGKGAPFWRFVTKDTQSWSRLFTEEQILSGQM